MNQEQASPDTTTRSELASWIEAFASLSGEVLIVLDPSLRVLYWPQSAELLLGWPTGRTLGFGLGSVLSLPSATQAALRDAIEARSTLADVVLPARRIGGMRCRLRATLQPVVGDGGVLLGAAISLRNDEPDSPLPAPSVDLSPLLEPLPVPVALVDAAGTVRIANELARATLGMESGRPCCEAFCNRFSGGCRTRRILIGQGPSFWEAEDNGRHFDMTATPLSLHKAEANAVLYFGVPSSSQLTPELRKFYRAVNENMSGVVIADSDGRIEYANPRASEILGYSLPEITGRDVRSFTHSPELLAVSTRQPPLRQGSSEMPVYRQDGSPRRVRIAISDIRGHDGHIGNWVILFDDVSEHRALEAKEQALREQLAHAARLAAVGEIASMIAHEINQPLSSIANYGRGMLLRMARGPIGEGDLREALDEIVAQVGRADRIIQNVRSLARKRQAAVRATSINETIAANQAVFRLLASSTGVRIELQPDSHQPIVTADPVQIEQVLVNLVKNAVDASTALPPEQRVVTVRSRTLEDGRVSIEVEDRAPMPPAEIFERIGEPFFTTKAEGLGLGLSITRTLLEYHGTRLGIRPGPDGRKIFHFELEPAKDHGCA